MQVLGGQRCVGDRIRVREPDPMQVYSESEECAILMNWGSMARIAARVRSVPLLGKAAEGRPCLSCGATSSAPASQEGCEAWQWVAGRSEEAACLCPARRPSH